MARAKPGPPAGALKFAAFSAAGIFVFFVPVGGRVPIDRATGALYAALAPVYLYLVLAMCAWAIFDMLRTGSYKKSAPDAVLSAFKLLGTAVTLLVAFRADVPFLMAEGVAPATLDMMARSVIMIFTVAAFLPLLLDYGLVESVGILAKRVMRPAFKIPGITAVVCAGAAVANFSIALISAGRLYRAGRLTERETAVVATGFSTVSIGLMLLICQLFGFSDMFLFYFAATSAVTYAVTAITARLPPLSRLPDAFCEGAKPDAEKDAGEGKLAKALEAGAAAAAGAPPLFAAVRGMLFLTLKILSGMISSCMFVIVAGLLLNEHTPVFHWLGMAFYPVLRLFGMPEARSLAAGIGLAAVDVIPAVMFASALDLPAAARYVMAAFPVSVIIFAGSYYSCLVAAGIPVKARHLAALWFQRALLSLAFHCAIGLLVFGR